MTKPILSWLVLAFAISVILPYEPIYKLSAWIILVTLYSAFTFSRRNIATLVALFLIACLPFLIQYPQFPNFSPGIALSLKIAIWSIALAIGTKLTRN